MSQDNNLNAFSTIGVSALTIVMSEFGDNTFFLALIMATQYPRLAVFSGVMVATLLTTIFSAFIGNMFTLIPFWVTCYISSAVFTLFGLSMLKEGFYMRPGKAEREYKEAEDELKKHNEQAHNKGLVRFLSDTNYNKAMVQAFTITFLGEWGDRSQFTTIFLAARLENLNVIIGTMAGHALCAAMSVIAGRLLAEKLSIRLVTLSGGILFLGFAITSLIAINNVICDVEN